MGLFFKSAEELFEHAQKLDDEKRYEEAFRDYLAAAKKGHVGAMYCVAYDYYNGEGVAQSETAAFPWYLKAAEAGDKRAYFRVGYDYGNGVGTAKDPAKAIHWYKKHVAAYSDKAEKLKVTAYNLAANYNALKEYDIALAWALEAARLGDEDAPGLAERIKGRGGREGRVTINLATAEAAVVPEAAVRAKGTEKTQNIDLKDNFESPEELYRRAQKLDDEKRYEEAFKLYLAAAEKGHVGAMYCVGYDYYKGEGVAQSETAAFPWYLKAAEAGDKRAYFRVGYDYGNGIGTEKDYTKAIYWYKKQVAAYTDKPEKIRVTAYNLAANYNSLGDYDTALAWALEAARLGDKDAPGLAERIRGRGGRDGRVTIDLEAMREKPAAQPKPVPPAKPEAAAPATSSADAQAKSFFKEKPKSSEKGPAPSAPKPVQAQAPSQNAEELYRRGHKYYAVGDYSRAEEFFLQAAEAGHNEAKYVLARVYKRKRNKDAALTWAKRALENADEGLKKEIEEFISELQSE